MIYDINLGGKDEAIIAFKKGNNSNIMKQLRSLSAIYDIYMRHSFLVAGLIFAIVNPNSHELKQ